MISPDPELAALAWRALPVGLVHAGATWIMVGLIWFVQLVHYPLLASVGTGDRFTDYMSEHARRTTWIVAPAMLFEAATACLLLFAPLSPLGRGLAIAGLALLGVNWLSTAFVQVPCHRHLQNERDEATIRRLVASNWVRTIAWTLRGFIALALLVATARAAG